MTVSHGEKFSRVHSPSAMWVQSVTTSDFEVCARESGIGSMFVLVEGGKPEDPEENSRSNEKNQQQT